MSEVASTKAAKSASSGPQEEENPSHELKESFFSSADKSLDSRNYLPVPKVPCSKPSGYPNRLFHVAGVSLT
jgi:hypothetical protein